MLGIDMNLFLTGMPGQRLGLNCWDTNLVRERKYKT